jgi:hypothetical protein
MSFLARLAGLLGLASPAPTIPPGAALAATITVVSLCWSRTYFNFALGVI